MCPWKLELTNQSSWSFGLKRLQLAKALVLFRDHGNCEASEPGLDFQKCLVFSPKSHIHEKLGIVSPGVITWHAGRFKIDMLVFVCPQLCHMFHCLTRRFNLFCWKKKIPVQFHKMQLEHHTGCVKAFTNFTVVIESFVLPFLTAMVLFYFCNEQRFSSYDILLPDIWICLCISFAC
jgi:hypothetical protein